MGWGSLIFLHWKPLFQGPHAEEAPPQAWIEVECVSGSGPGLCSIIPYLLPAHFIPACVPLCFTYYSIIIQLCTLEGEFAVFSLYLPSHKNCNFGEGSKFI